MPLIVRNERLSGTSAGPNGTFATVQARLLAAGHAPGEVLVVMEATGS